MFVLLILLHYPSMNSIYQLYNVMNRKTAKIQTYIRFLYFYILLHVTNLQSPPIRYAISEFQECSCTLFTSHTLKSTYYARDACTELFYSLLSAYLYLSTKNSVGWFKRRRPVVYLISARIIFTVFTSRS